MGEAGDAHVVVEVNTKAGSKTLRCVLLRLQHAKELVEVVE